MKTFRFSISNGAVKTIYDDAHVELFAQGQATTRRASHVEPGPGGWFADMEPVTPGVKLGPFKLRSEALAAEVEYLNKILF